MVVDDRGRAFESDAPASAAPGWSAVRADRSGSAFTTISCVAAGFCAAADARGETLSAVLPPPFAQTGPAAPPSTTTATLSAAVDPNDASLVGCRFEYGLTTAYGAGASCTPAPRATGGRQTVRARLVGLTPASRYHFRIVAASPAGTSAGGDRVLETPPLARASPSLSGTPAVGGTLKCHPGVTISPPATLAFAWWRNTTQIDGAGAPTYAITTADETHHLSCTVSVAGDGGVTIVKSGFAAIPPEQTITESFVGAGTARGTSVAAPVTCSPQASPRCVITLQMSAGSGLAAAAEPVSVGSAMAVVPAGSTRTLAVSLNRRGRVLMSARHSLTVTFTVSGTLLGALTAPLQTQTLLLRDGHGPAGAIAASGHRTAHQAP